MDKDKQGDALTRWIQNVYENQKLWYQNYFSNEVITNNA